jgi:hypothetical protein
VTGRRPVYVIPLWISPQLRERRPDLPLTMAEAEAAAQPTPEAEAEAEPEPET